MAAYFISGVAALIYEVSWMRPLGGVFGSTAYAQATMLSAFMCGLGAGAILGGRVAKKSSHPLRNAAHAELAVCVTSVLTLIGLRAMPPVFFDALRWMTESPVVFLGGQFVVAFVLMALPTLGMGATFPLVMAGIRPGSRTGRWAGWLYGWNTAGAILGSLIAGLVLIPLFGVTFAVGTAMTLNFTAAAIIATLSVRAEGRASFWRSPDWIVALAALALLLVVPHAADLPLGVSELGRHASAAEYRDAVRKQQVLFSAESIYSRVVVTQWEDGARLLYNGPLHEGSDRLSDAVTTRGLALLPAMSAEATSSALVVGLGTGSTPAALLRLGFGSVRTVEINPAVVPASTYFVGDVLTRDPRSNIIVDDARSYLLTNEDRYDVITAEPSWPLSAATAPLFTREMMEAASARLNDGGVMCQWLPLYLVDDSTLAMMYKTMRSVFPRVDAWSIEGEEGVGTDLVLVGFKDAKGPSQSEIVERGNPLWAANLNMPIGRFSPYGDSKALETAATDPSVPLNTDDHSLLEYRVVWNLLKAARQEGQQ